MNIPLITNHTIHIPVVFSEIKGLIAEYFWAVLNVLIHMSKPKQRSNFIVCPYDLLTLISFQLNLTNEISLSIAGSNYT